MRKRRRMRKRAGVHRTATYFFAMGALLLSGMAFLVGALLLHASLVEPMYGLVYVALMAIYIMLLPGLLIPYSLRFWFVPCQISHAKVLWLAALCGVLFPLAVGVVLIVGESAGLDMDIVDVPSMYWAALIGCSLLGMLLSAMGLPRAISK